MILPAPRVPEELDTKGTEAEPLVPLYLDVLLLVTTEDKHHSCLTGQAGRAASSESKLYS